MSEDMIDNRGASPGENRPEWMSSISGIVDPEDYLLGRKIDKTFELHQQEKVERAKKQRADLIATDKLKLNADPILDLERRKYELKLEIISNPIKLKRFREYILRKEREASQNVHLNSRDESKEFIPVSQPTRETHTTKELSRSRIDRESARFCPSNSSSSSSSSRFERHSRRKHERRGKGGHKRRCTERVSSHRRHSLKDRNKSRSDQKYRRSSRSDKREASGQHRRSRSRSRSSDRKDNHRHHDKRR